MANALKCDRCGSYFDYNPALKNFIAFGHKDIIIGKNFPVKDICPDCIESFMNWFEAPKDSDDNETTKKLCYFEYCKDCLSLFRKPPLPGETGYSEVRCGRWHTGIPMRGADPKLIDSITPDMFIKEEKPQTLHDLYPNPDFSKFKEEK